MTEDERIESIKRYGGDHLKNFKTENKTYDMCMAAVQSSGWALNYVPEKFRSNEIYQAACKNNGMMLNCVPEEKRTQELCELAVESSGISLQFVPLQYITEDLCKKAAIRSSQAYWFIPTGYITPEFVTDVAHKSNLDSIGNLPDTFKKSPFYYELVCHDPEFIWYIPRKALTAKIGKAAIKGMGYPSAAIAVKEIPKLLSRLHYSLYDHDTCLNFVTSEYFHKSIRNDRYGNAAWGFNTQEDEKAGRFFLDEKYYDTYSLPHMMKWPDVAIPFLQLNGYYIIFCQDDIISEEMCKVAIASNAYSFKYIPSRYKTEAMCLYSFAQSPYSIEYFPAEYITEEMAFEAVCHSGYILKDIPDCCKSKRVCLTAVSDNGRGKIENVPLSVLDKEIVLAYLANTTWGIHELQKIPKELWDYDVCLAAVKKDGDDLQFVPSEYVDYAMCLEAVKQSSGAAKYVPEGLFSNELALATVANSQYNFKYIPKPYITEEVCIQAISHGERCAGTILKEVPPEMVTQKMCDLAVEVSPHSLEYVPECFVTEEMLLSVARDACALVRRNFPERLQTKEFIKKLIDAEPSIRFYLSESILQKA